MLWLWNNVKGYAIIAGAAVAAFGAAYLKGRSDAAAGQRQREAEEARRAHAQAEEVRQDVARSSDAGVAERLRAWTRR